MTVAERLRSVSSLPGQSNAWSLSGCLPPGRILSTVLVTGPTFVIGRQAEADLPLASLCVSSRHAELLLIGNNLFVRDLGSTNGTFVNRVRVRQPTPLIAGDHIQIADIEFRLDSVTSNGRSKLEDLKKTARVMDSLEGDWILSQFHELLSQRAVTPHYQKIVDLNSQAIMGFEALARSGMCGLENPGRMFQTAQLVSREAELSIICRQKAAECGDWMPPGTAMFLNTHPNESLEVDVLPSLIGLRKAYPQFSLVVEIHEGAIENPARMRDFIDEVRDAGIKVAYDDFGAGQSRLLELVKAPPDYLKFDASLIRDIHQASSHQRRMLQFLVQMALDVPTIPLAEGIETKDEAEVCIDLGFQLAQGYLFGRPVSANECARQTLLLRSKE